MYAIRLPAQMHACMYGLGISANQSTTRNHNPAPLIPSRFTFVLLRPLLIILRCTEVQLDLTLAYRAFEAVSHFALSNYPQEWMRLLTFVFPIRLLN